MSGVTKAEGQVLTVISNYVAEHGIPPSRREIALAMGWRRLGDAQSTVDRLVSKGLLRRLVGRARAIELTRPAILDPSLTFIPLPDFTEQDIAEAREVTGGGL